jgi:hypothetical protein
LPCWFVDTTCIQTKPSNHHRCAFTFLHD